MAVTYVDRWLKCPIGGTHLSGDDIHAILYLYPAEGFTRYRLAKDYKCSWPHIDNIVKGRYKFVREQHSRYVFR